MKFTREQLTSRYYEPIEVGLVDLADLRRRYEGKVSLNHAAAIRGVLLKEGGPQLWIWGCGLLYDEMATAHDHERPLARYRKQYGMLARVEFETGSNMQDGLRLLLETTPIGATDPLNVSGIYGLLGCSIRDCLEVGT